MIKRFIQFLIQLRSYILSFFVDKIIILSKDNKKYEKNIGTTFQQCGSDEKVPVSVEVLSPLESKIVPDKINQDAQSASMSNFIIKDSILFMPYRMGNNCLDPHVETIERITTSCCQLAGM